MAHPQLGQPFPSVANSAPPSAASQLLMSSSSSSPSSGSKCCEGGRPIMTDPHTGQTVCSCQYSSSLLSYPRVAGLPESMYGSAYAAQGYMPFGTDPSAFYSLNPAYGELKDTADAWRSALAQPLGYAYDPATMTAYPYTNGYGGMDLSAAARRKNVAREATSTLKAWLYEHRKNPYPTKGEKIMLAIITKMTLTQVSTWFANARRRLKKENKMTWSPRSKPGEGGDNSDDDMDDNDDAENNNKENSDNKEDSGNKSDIDGEKELFIDPGRGGAGEGPLSVSSDPDQDSKDGVGHLVGLGGLTRPGLPPPHHAGFSSPSSSSTSSSALSPTGGLQPGRAPTLPAGYRHLSANSGPVPGVVAPSASQGGAGTAGAGVGDPNPQQKPRIWSLADVATSHDSCSSSSAGRRPCSPPAPAFSLQGLGGGKPSSSSSMSAMNSMRSLHSAYPVSVSHPTALTHPYGLHSLQTSRAPAATITSSVQGSLGLPRYGMTGLGVTTSLAFPGGARDLHRPSHNGLFSLPGDRPGSTDSTSGSTSSDCLEINRTAFKPVTKSKLGDIVRV